MVYASINTEGKSLEHISDSKCKTLNLHKRTRVLSFQNEKNQERTFVRTVEY
jgi:hypothetical protein